MLNIAFPAMNSDPLAAMVQPLGLSEAPALDRRRTMSQF
jgi:hypothetical protein